MGKRIVAKDHSTRGLLNPGASYPIIMDVGEQGLANGRKTFRLDIEGEGVAPETTRASDLADLAAHLERAILETASDQGVELGDDAFISLVGIEQGSNRLMWAVAALVLPAVTAISGAVSSNDFTRLPRAAHQALHNISRKAVDRKWSVRFIGDDPTIVRPAEISVQHPVPPPSIPEVRGTTTLFGRCVRVGGMRPRAEISLQRGGTLFIDVSEALARKLAQRLYEQVSLDGEASWDAQTWSIQSFRATDVADFRPGSLVSAFHELSAAADGAWDGVDVEVYVAERRHGGHAE